MGDAQGEPAGPGRVEVGEVLGGYRLEALLGRGATSRVFLGVHVRLGRRAAIKALHPGLASYPAVVERVFREAKVVNDIRHHNIIDVADFVTQAEPPRVALIMELVEGPSLAAARGRPMSRPQALGVLIQLTRAVAAAHEAGVIHRDLKPENLLLTLDPWSEPEAIPTLKIVDFGLAKVLGPLDRRGATHHLLGTPTYMAPEQISGRPAPTAATDVYAIGELIFELLTGARAFPASGPAHVVRAKMRGDLPSFDALPSRDGWARRLITRALDVDPAERPGILEVLEILVAACPSSVLEVGRSSWGRGLAEIQATLRSASLFEAAEDLRPGTSPTLTPSSPASARPDVAAAELRSRPRASTPLVGLPEAATTVDAPSELATPVEEHLPTRRVAAAGLDRAAPGPSEPEPSLTHAMTEPSWGKTRTDVRTPNELSEAIALPRRRWPIEGIVIVAIVATVTGLYALRAGPSPALGPPPLQASNPAVRPLPSPSPAAEPRPVRVTVTSAPAGATVRRLLDGVILGQTPLEVVLAPREAILELGLVAPGHRPDRLTVRRGDGGAARRHVTLAPSAQPSPRPRPRAPDAADPKPLGEAEVGGW